MIDNDHIEKSPDDLIAALSTASKTEQAELMDKLVEYSDASVEPLVRVLQTSSHYELREAAAKSLGRIGSTRGVAALIKATRDESETVGAAAIEALCKIGDRSTLSVVIEALDSQFSFIRESAVFSLLSFGKDDPRLLDAVMAALHDEDHFVREAAAIALGEARNTSVVQALIDAMGDEDTLVQDAAMDSLKKIGSFAVDLLGNELSSDRNSTLKIRIVLILGKIADMRAMELIRRSWNDPNSSVRGTATSILGAVDSIQAASLSMDALSSEFADVRLEAIQVLGQLGDKNAVEQLTALSQHDPNSVVRETALQTIRQIENKL